MNIPMTPTTWKIARYAAIVLLGALGLRVAQCDAVRHAEAEARVKTADSATAVAKRSADSIDHVRTTETSALRDSLAHVAASAASTQRAVDRARELDRAITITREPDRKARIVMQQEAAPPVPMGDTTAYDRVTRAGDPASYRVPRFLSTLIAAQRTAIDSQATQLARTSNALDLALRTIATDSGALRARDTEITNLRIAEETLKRERSPFLGFKAGLALGATGTLLVGILASHVGK